MINDPAKLFVSSKYLLSFIHFKSCHHFFFVICVRASWHSEDARGWGGADQAHEGRASAAARDADPAPHRDDDREKRHRTGEKRSNIENELRLCTEMLCVILLCPSLKCLCTVQFADIESFLRVMRDGETHEGGARPDDTLTAQVPAQKGGPEPLTC